MHKTGIEKFGGEKTSTNKMNHIKTMLYGHFIGINKLERLKLLQNDPLINEFAISIKVLETVSRFLGNSVTRPTQMFERSISQSSKSCFTKASYRP
jgi:hypothetical protein